MGETRTFRCRGILVLLLAPAAVLLGSCCKRANLVGLLDLKPPIEVKGLTNWPTRSVEMDLGVFRVRELPVDWQLREVPEQDPNRARFAVLRGGTTLIKGVAEGPCQQIVDKAFVERHAWKVFPTSEYDANYLTSRYPDDRAIYRAIAALPPGDPTRGGACLSEQEQHTCVLANICRTLFPPECGIPTRVEHEGKGIFVGVAPTGKGFLGIVMMFVDKSTEHWSLLLAIRDPAISPEEAMRIALQFAKCVDVRDTG